MAHGIGDDLTHQEPHVVERVRIGPALEEADGGARLGGGGWTKVQLEPDGRATVTAPCRPQTIRHRPEGRPCNGTLCPGNARDFLHVR